ncbi:hypothetical protein VPH35_090085 [Triticum aestivum]
MSSSSAAIYRLRRDSSSPTCGPGPPPRNPGARQGVATLRAARSGARSCPASRRSSGIFNLMCVLASDADAQLGFSPAVASLLLPRHPMPSTDTTTMMAEGRARGGRRGWVPL